MTVRKCSFTYSQQVVSMGERYVVLSKIASNNSLFAICSSSAQFFLAKNREMLLEDFAI